MKWSRGIRFAIWCGMAPAALGCKQLAGLSDDYQLANTGGQGAAAGQGTAGANGGDAGETGATGGDAGANGGEAGSNGGTAGSSGGTAGSNGGTAGSSGGTAGSSGGTAGSGGGGAGQAGTGGSAGAGAGPVRIGFAEFHDSASGGDQASAHLADATFAKPAGTATGDLILVFFGADHYLSNLSGNTLTAEGWTLLDQHENYGTDGQATYLIYKFAGASEPDPIVFAGINSAPSGNGVQGLLSVYRGVNTGSPINAYKAVVVPTGQQNITHVTTATPAITTTAANCLLIAGLSPDTVVEAPVITSWPSGFVENQVSVNNPPNPYPYGWANIYSAERHLAVAGTVPASAFGWDISNDGSEYYGSLSFVLALAP